TEGTAVPRSSQQVLHLDGRRLRGLLRFFDAGVADRTFQRLTRRAADGKGEARRAGVEVPTQVRLPPAVHMLEEIVDPVAAAVGPGDQLFERDGGHPFASASSSSKAARSSASRSISSCMVGTSR